MSQARGVFSVHLLEHVLMMASFLHTSGYLATAYAMVDTVISNGSFIGFFRPGLLYVIHKLALSDPQQ